MSLSEFRPPAIKLATDELCAISLEDVEFITKDNKNNTIFHHSDGHQYRLVNSVDDYDRYFFDNGLCSLDNGNVVNVYKTEYYDEKRSHVYFGPQKTRSASVALIHKSFVKYFIKERNTLKTFRQIGREFSLQDAAADQRWLSAVRRWKTKLFP